MVIIGGFIVWCHSDCTKKKKKKKKKKKIAFGGWSTLRIAITFTPHTFLPCLAALLLSTDSPHAFRLRTWFGTVARSLALTCLHSALFCTTTYRITAHPICGFTGTVLYTDWRSLLDGLCGHYDIRTTGRTHAFG